MIKEATTLSPDEEKENAPLKKEVTASGEKAITSEKINQKLQTPSDEETKRVTELESEVDALKTKLNQATDLQRQADKSKRIEIIERKRIEKQLKKIQTGDEYISPEETEGETQVEKEIRLEAKISIQNLILDNPEYQELIKKDITLKEVLRNNPFALIGEYFDAEDAVEQIKEKLDERVFSLQSKIQPKEDAEKGQSGSEENNEEGGKEFDAGVVQPKETETPSKPQETSSTTPMDSVEESIRNKIKIT